MNKTESSKKKGTKEDLKFHSDDSFSSDDLNIDNVFKNEKQNDKGKKNNVYQKEKIKNIKIRI